MTLRAPHIVVGLLAAVTAMIAPLAIARATGPISDPAAVVDQFHDAISRGDAEAVASTLADDAVIYEQGGAEASKGEYVTGHLPGDIAYSAGLTESRTSRRTEVAGPLAVVMSQGRTTGTYGGKPVDRLTTETMVLKRTKSAWRVVHIHWSSRAAKA
ncbi:MAG: nuclear transport factor 2 family protein [Caulobacterales bacterium]|nr:nuclear transport factor 2 family protein [Caulobacterales bacterium]